MDQLDGLEQQIEFFRQNQYKLALEKSMDGLCYHALLSLRYIEVLSPKYDDLKKGVRRRCKNALIAYGKEFGYARAVRTWFNYRYLKRFKKMLERESIFTCFARKVKEKLVYKKNV